MNATVSLINAGLDVAVNSAKLFVSVAQFAYCLGVVTRQAAEATYNAGKATRQWMDEVIANAEAPQAETVQSVTTPTVNIPDPWDGEAPVANNIIPYPAMPHLLAPMAIAGYLPPGLDVSPTPKTDALKELLTAHQANMAELITVTANLVADKEEDLTAQYNDLGIRDLRNLAKSKGITKYSRKSKAALLKELATV
ncbi:hypothetical protein [Synechococcus sp. PCC 6312]|uniref:hypothetical protein n=1 Tax=Synechococcus sp. (strain ATCC 27167 / PCC 6312) TaxID=195253 RepID=UPI00029EC808|nr:hypothetical protein [Synechococcus sp. PCC 6312]AFY60083.1 hypothetical protein Syn6312_0875 [Synechococcus sp. PCC 6312]